METREETKKGLKRKRGLPRAFGKSRKYVRKSERDRRKRRRIEVGKALLVFLLSGTAAVAFALVMAGKDVPLTSIVEGIDIEELIAAMAEADAENDSGLQAESETETETETETEEPGPELFHPVCTENTAPSRLISMTGISVDDTELAEGSDYVPETTISFEKGGAYTNLEGVITFRGNNFRDTAAFGTADMREKRLEPIWSKQTGALSYNGSVWTGNGWTGQPLLVKWPQETKQKMNMQDWAKADENLIEVIYASMDGYVYFLDLKTGRETRNALYLGFTFKGSGALDPRGYPILYVGSGYDSTQGTSHVFVVNLLDCSVMYEFGANDPFSLRGTLSYFDSSALVDAETDTLLYPGENGILYLIRLNTDYDPDAGTLSIAPSPVVKWHYYGNRTSTASFWLGMEDSAAVYGGYLFIADNGGHLMCLDLNTLKLVWVQDILDDSNSTPVLSMEDGHLYLYVSTSFRLGWRSYNTATVPVWKIDAENGEIVWQKDYECYSEDGVSGGVQSTIASGKNSLSDYIYVTVARTGDYSTGVLACLDKKTGNVVWEHPSYYAWSSPVCIYDTMGKGTVLYCNSVGTMYLIDGETGTVLNSIGLDSSNIEASPAVYDNYVVIGTRGCHIWGVELK